MNPDLQSLLGMTVILAFAWIVGGLRRPFPLRLAASALLMQAGFAAMLLKLPPFKELFLALNRALAALEQATQTGTSFVFGFLGGGPLPFETANSGATFVLAFRALPLVLVVSALSSLLFHWRILPVIVQASAWLLRRTLGIGGAVGLSAAADIFVGMIEAPLFVRPYLARMSRGELFSVMSCGMATISGTVMVLYASVLSQVVPDAMGHILTASLVTIPGALLVAELLVSAESQATDAKLAEASEARSSIDAITQGTLAGVDLLINIIAMLIVFVALVSLTNGMLSLLPELNGTPLTLQRVFGWIMAPAVWLMGIPWGEAVTAGGLMGTKTVLNELLAYLDLAALPPDALSERSRLIMIYALCGFANFGSLGILIGGLGAMAPERRGEVVSLGPLSIVSGTLSTLLTGSLIGVLS